MTDAIVWADKLPGIIKKWILIVPIILAAIGSSTGIYQYFDKQHVIETAEQEKTKAIHEVATGFQSVLTEKPEKPKVQIRTCGNCQKLISAAIKRIEKLERWH